MRMTLFVALGVAFVALADGSKKGAPVDGVTIHDEAEAAKLVEAQLRGNGPWSAREDYTPADGLGRAITEAGPWLPVFARTIAAHVEDSDVAVRTLAVFLLERVAKELGAAPILKSLERSPKLFDGVKPVGHPTNQPDLRWSMLMALGTAVAWAIRTGAR